MIGLESYRRRVLRDEPVWIYRNLMRRDGVWYSIMQRGRVVAHARELLVRDARFVVRPGGHRRFKETGVKNVHAFVVGRIAPLLDMCAMQGEWRPARYNPHHAPAFIDASLGDGSGNRLLGARAARLGADGLRVLL